jgi:phosphopantetheinyl transferase
VRVLRHRNAVSHGDLRRGCGHDADGQTQAQHQFAQFHGKTPRGLVDDNKLEINLSYKFDYGVIIGHLT